MAATLTAGGALAGGAAVFFLLLPVAFAPVPAVALESFSTAATSVMVLRHALRWDDTCSASSRVGARIRARR